MTTQKIDITIIQAAAQVKFIHFIFFCVDGVLIRYDLKAVILIRAFSPTQSTLNHFSGVGVAAGLMGHSEKMKWNLDPMRIMGADGTGVNTGREVRFVLCVEEEKFR